MLFGSLALLMSTTAMAELLALPPGAKVTQVVTGGRHACALFANGSVKCWGSNDALQLGYQDASNNLGDQPGEVGRDQQPLSFGRGRKATQLAAGVNHTCALLDDGSVRCWGAANEGQLGRDFAVIEARSADLLAPATLGRRATKIAAAGNGTCALLSNATLKCWGNNQQGQLGQDPAQNPIVGDDGNEMANLKPISVGAGLTVTQFAMGYAHTCAILSNATVKCWGYNEFGQLGHGDQQQKFDVVQAPVTRLGTLKPATLSLGLYHSCVLFTTGRSKCWGMPGATGTANGTMHGALPDTMGVKLPVLSLGTGFVVRQISAGVQHTCALLEKQTQRLVKCWGDADSGALGSENTTNRGLEGDKMGDTLTPAKVGDWDTVVQVATGGDGDDDNAFSCAVSRTGFVKCWGSNSFGQLGIGDTNNRGDKGGSMGNELPEIAF